MKFEQLLHLVGNLPWFDFATVLQLSGEPRQNLRVRLYEWRKAGKLITLRRGMYTLSAPYRQVALHPAVLSNHLYPPSYLSTHWALSFYGLIPEKTVVYTSVSSRVPRRFENDFGVFQYSNVKQCFFFGYRAMAMGGQEVLLATPEKALLDLWHLHAGAWHAERMLAMRFQNCEQVSMDRLHAAAARFAKPRLLAAVVAWQQMLESQETGTVLL